MSNTSLVVLFNPQMGEYGIHTIPNGIYPKVDVIAQQKFKLAYYNSGVQCFNNYITCIEPEIYLDNKNSLRV